MGDKCDKTMHDIIEKKEWEIRHEGNWMHNEREEFFRDYLDLPLPLQKEGPQFRARRAARSPTLAKYPPPPKPNQRGKKPDVIETRATWSDEDLKQAIDALDLGYTMRDICEALNMPRTSLRDHYRKNEGQKNRS